MSDKKQYGKLVINLRLGESVIIGESLITVVEAKNKTFRLAFNAPKDVKILRTNAVDKRKKTNQD